MPISFRDADDIEALGPAGFLRVVGQPPGVFWGALFLVNSRGEPVEFTYSSVETPNTFLWRQDDIRNHAVRTLATSLFTACPRTPKLLACLAEEVPLDLFPSQIHISIPVARIAPVDRATPHAPAEVIETTEPAQSHHLFWYPGVPAKDSHERQLMDRLIAGGLLVEPFERALVGLREVYGSATSQ
ncbi:MAG: hypothetical protein HY681_07415 [Chloroflexi bacterium]|nr:hypothetical protein [Chloroflexota bacterium]